MTKQTFVVCDDIWILIRFPSMWDIVIIDIFIAITAWDPNVVDLFATILA